MIDDPLPHVLAKSARAGRPVESLVSHLNATLRAAAELRDRVGRIEVADAPLGGEFWRAALLAALMHDAGKIADGFQRMLAGGGLWGQRHEVVSLGFLPALVPDPTLRRWVGSAVVTHHRPITDERGRSIQRQYGAADPDELLEMVGPISHDDAVVLAEWLAVRAGRAGLEPGSPNGAGDLVRSAHRVLGDLLDAWEDDVEDRRHGLTAVLLQGAVTLADHLSSAHRILHTSQPIGAGLDALVRRHVGGEFHPHQEQARQVPRHLLLRAPTGSGKTEAALLWAACQVVQLASAAGGTPRVFFTLPYLASINAMVGRLEGLLRQEGVVGVSHSRAASYHLATAIAGEDAERVDLARKAVSRAAATRLFQEPVRIGTPYQLLRGALAGPAHSGILVDSANSVFILDELHAYDAKRLGYILAMARLWERLGGRIAVLSATLPNALVEQLSEVLRIEPELVEAEGVDLRRHRLRVRERHLADPETLAEIRARLAADQAVLVVANNVAQAQELFAALCDEVHDRHGADAAILLHSRFKRGDRSDIERRIGDRYGTRVSRRPGLLVATQVVEVSLDVDFDVLFTAAAPLEALLQRFGRVNRLGDRPSADVIVYAPEYRVRRGDPDGQEYADGVYPRDPVECGWQILAEHSDEVVNETQAVRWLDRVYETEWGEQWRAEVRDARATFDNEFLAFRYPYDGRDELSERFDELFEGTEAILADDRERYEQALAEAVRADGRTNKAAGRLLGEEYLIPLPYWAAKLAGWDRALGVAVVDGDYDGDRGLLSVRGPEQATVTYLLGQVI